MKRRLVKQSLMNLNQVKLSQIKKPQTGDLTPLASVFSSIFVSLSGVYLVMRKKEY